METSRKPPRVIHPSARVEPSYQMNVSGKAESFPDRLNKWKEAIEHKKEIKSRLQKQMALMDCTFQPNAHKKVSPSKHYAQPLESKAAAVPEVVRREANSFLSHRTSYDGPTHILKSVDAIQKHILRTKSALAERERVKEKKGLRPDSVEKQLAIKS